MKGDKKIMSVEEMEANKGKPMLEQMQGLVPKAINILGQYMSGLAVDKKKVDVANSIIKEVRGLEQAQNNRMAQERENKRFNLKMFDMFGDEEQKNEIKEVFKKNFPKMKFINEH